MGFFGEQDRREWITLAGTQGGSHRRRISSLAFSALAHAALLAALAWPVAPLFITPRPVAKGEGGNAGAVASVTLIAPPDLNARIVGARINAAAWELLIAMLAMEAAFGVAGLVAAPIYYAYLKDELTARGLI